MQPDFCFQELNTSLFRIRRLRIQDSKEFHSYRSNPQVSRFQCWNHPFTEKDARRIITEQKLVHPDLPGQPFLCGIFTQENGSFIGECSLLTDAIDYKQVELNVSVLTPYKHPHHLGQILQSIFVYLFDHLNKNKIKFFTDADDKDLNHTLASLAMVCEAHYLENAFYQGAWHDQYLYTMLRREWIEHYRSLKRNFNQETRPNKAI